MTASRVGVKSVQRKSKLLVDVGPDKKSKNYRFEVQKKKRGEWTTVTVSTTKGKKDKRRLNLRKGKYRVIVPAQYGLAASTSNTVQLKH